MLEKLITFVKDGKQSSTRADDHVWQGLSTCQGLFLALHVCGNISFKPHNNPTVLILPSSMRVMYKNRPRRGHVTLVTVGVRDGAGVQTHTPNHQLAPLSLPFLKIPECLPQIPDCFGYII